MFAAYSDETLQSYEHLVLVFEIKERKVVDSYLKARG